MTSLQTFLKEESIIFLSVTAVKIRLNEEEGPNGCCFFFYLIGCKIGEFGLRVCVHDYINERLFLIHPSILVVIADPGIFVV
jgi:hypothetical protein